MAQNNAAVGALEIAAAGFLLQEGSLFFAELGEVIQTVLHPRLIGLVFAAVQIYEARVSPTEGSIRFLGFAW